MSDVQSTAVKSFHAGAGALPPLTVALTFASSVEGKLAMQSWASQTLVVLAECLLLASLQADLQAGRHRAFHWVGHPYLQEVLLHHQVALPCLQEVLLQACHQADHPCQVGHLPAGSEAQTTFTISETAIMQE